MSLILLTQITYLQKDFKSKFKDYTENCFFVLHLNIRSLSKNLESFKKLYNLLSFKFSILCFSETWSKDEKINENSLYQLESHNLSHQYKKHKKVEVLQYLSKINILLKIELILALIVKQLRVSHLR